MLSFQADFLISPAHTGMLSFQADGGGQKASPGSAFSQADATPPRWSPRHPHAAVLGPWWGSFPVDAPLRAASPSDQTVHVRFRIKKVLMPSVPDPRFSFLGLFESHQGNFQVSTISLYMLALGKASYRSSSMSYLFLPRGIF